MQCVSNFHYRIPQLSSSSILSEILKSRSNQIPSAHQQALPSNRRDPSNNRQAKPRNSASGVKHPNQKRSHVSIDGESLVQGANGKQLSNNVTSDPSKNTTARKYSVVQNEIRVKRGKTSSNVIQEQLPEQSVLCGFVLQFPCF